MKQPWRFLVSVIVFVIVGWYIGAMFDFFPFYADDFAVSAVGFATLILSVVMAACTILIVKKKDKD